MCICGEGCSDGLGQKRSANYGIISVSDNQCSYSGTFQLNISPEFRNRFQEISIPSRLYHINQTVYLTCGGMIKDKVSFSTWNNLPTLLNTNHGLLLFYTIVNISNFGWRWVIFHFRYLLFLLGRLQNHIILKEWSHSLGPGPRLGWLSIIEYVRLQKPWCWLWLCPPTSCMALEKF